MQCVEIFIEVMLFFITMTIMRILIIYLFFVDNEKWGNISNYCVPG